MNEEFFKITQDGKIKQCFYREEERQMMDSIVESLASGVQRGCNRLLDLGGNYGGVGFTANKKGFSTWSVRILKLPLTCPFNTENGVVTPVFDNATLPELSLLWEVPPDMCLILGITMTEKNNSFIYYEQYVSAFDKRGAMYRLPLSNLYADTKLCHGLRDGGTLFKSAMQVVGEVTKQFDASKWSKDLYGEDSGGKAGVRERTKKLFRFEPKNDGFKQLPPTEIWTTLADKVGKEVLQKTLIPVAL